MARVEQRRHGGDFGATSRNSPSRLAASSTFKVMNPVALPPGRLKLATRPNSTGGSAIRKTIGMVLVAALAATAAGVLDNVAISETCRRIRSAVSSGSLSFCPEAQRNSIATFRPSTKPAVSKPLRSEATRLTFCSADPECRNPMTGIPAGCACAASGHAAAAPPRSPMNSRRFIPSPPTAILLLGGS